MRRTVLCLAALPLVFVACSRSRGETQPAPVSSAAPAPLGTLALGERITSPIVALEDIVRDPALYRGRVVATSGRVTSVCREMGCWLELQDSAGRAHVRIHGHQFFVPKTAPGHIARVQATVVKGGRNEDDCEEQAGSSGTSTGLAKIELEATGVEID